MGKTSSNGALAATLDEWLDSARIKDASFNGLQVAGRRELRRLVSGVTANRALIEAAIAAGADGVLVHHGLFWKGDDPRLVGYRGERVALLMRHELNVYAYHLPLDVHPELGNNAQMARRLGLDVQGQRAEGLLWSGGWSGEATAEALAAHCAATYGEQTRLLVPARGPVRSVGWCSGAGGSLLAEAVNAGLDAFITGEVNEQYIHEARESGIALITAGHHATERDGVRALGERVARDCGIEVQFIDVPSPL